MEVLEDLRDERFCVDDTLVPGSELVALMTSDCRGESEGVLLGDTCLLSPVKLHGINENTYTHRYWINGYV